MPNYIVLRLTPPTPLAAADFTASIANLTAIVWDISYAAASPALATNGPALGTVSTPAGTIIQTAGESIATAVIEYPPLGPPLPEYVTPDLLIQFSFGPGTPTYSPTQICYDVDLYTAGPLTPAAIQAIPDSDVSAFVTIPLASRLLTLSSDGSPPNFDALLAAVDTVLTADPGGALPALADLTVEQCQNIAYEIVFGPQAPLPAPAETTSNLYTNPPNDGTIGNSHEQNRQQFEGNLGGYYGTLDAAAVKLTNWVFALSTAYWFEAQTQAAAQALMTFPVNPNPPPGPPSSIPTTAEAQIIFTGALGLDVPAAYFYALNASMSALVGQDSTQQKQTRQGVILGADQQDNLNTLRQALNTGLITLAPALNPAQAVRIIEALNVPAASAIGAWPIAPAAGFPLVGWELFNTGWLGQLSWTQYPPVAAWQDYQDGDDLTDYWPTLAVNQPVAFLDLVMMALTRGSMVGAVPLAQILIAHFLLVNVGGITAITPEQWQAFFDANSADLPDFTQPGTTAARTAAFIQWVQQFFELDAAPFVLPPAASSTPPHYDAPAFDVLGRTIADYPIAAFPTPLNLATLEAAASLAAPGDPQAQAWAVQAVETINQLAYLAAGLGAAALESSVMEALFARGFVSREQVLELRFADFQQALIGTIAYDFAAAIYANAGPAPVFPPPPPGVFGPINPGSLTDCIPPPWLSPLGPVEYLHEMLKVSERSTCDKPFAPPAPGHTILQAHIDVRRGPIETLAVDAANLETPLPLIDIVNECLQRVAARTPRALPGAVYNTAQNHLGPYKLCDDHCDRGEDHHDCACEQHPCECREQHHPHDGDDCHKPAAIFAALSEYSTPAAPVPADAGDVPAVWNKLASDFSACCLPYNQALDVNRTYLDFFRTCRFETMRTFRRCITEFALDPVNEPADFQDHLWRYPVRLDIAIEYLDLSIEEFETLFKGVMPPLCGDRDRDRPPRPRGEPGVGACLRAGMSRGGVIRLPEFLKCTCLTYCEFLELVRSGFAPIENDRDRHGFPECEPCCLEDLCLRLPVEGDWVESIAIFVRLWRKLRHHCGTGYTFAELADICKIFDLASPDFIRQLAAFQMLRDQFRLRLRSDEKPPAGATGADRTFLLALWIGPGAKHWRWAVHQLLEGVERRARCHYDRQHRGAEFIKLLAENFDPLSRLAGFDPAAPAWTWWARPTHTLRFAEILTKLYASDFSIGEVSFLFTAGAHLDGDDPFPEQDEDDALDRPLQLPGEAHGHSLWALRDKLLQVRVEDDAVKEWTWHAISSALAYELGFDDNLVGSLGRHFFPQELEREGQPVDAAERRFSVHLAPTNAGMWNAPPPGPFHYDPAALQLWSVLPIADHAVIGQLSRISPLSPAERQAAQDVYFLPRRLLVHFAMLFEDFAEAERRLIEGRGEERWDWFRGQFAKALARCRTIAEHLKAHVEAATSQHRGDGYEAAHTVLRHLFADENASTAPGWENDDGSVPAVTWVPPANGGAFAALLGLTGTGLDAELTAGGAVAWRDVSDGMNVFGPERDHENCPVPTVIPSLGLTLTPQQMAHVSVRNGLVMKDATGEWLGGGQGFKVKWSGLLLIDHTGRYHFCAGAPSREGEEPNMHDARGRSWRVELRRGQKTWVLLRLHWHHEPEIDQAELELHAGAYSIAVELVQHEPDFLHPPFEREHTGFEIAYRGPDTHEQLVALPRSHLFRTRVDRRMDVPGLSPAAESTLHNRYGSSIRDIRRTYQRAFKALLLVHRFALTARARRGRIGTTLLPVTARSVRRVVDLLCRRRLAYAQGRLRFQLPSGWRPVLFACRRRPVASVGQARGRALRLVGTPVRLHAHAS